MKGKITCLFPKYRLIFWLSLYLIVGVELLNINVRQILLCFRRQSIQLGYAKSINGITFH